MAAANLNELRDTVNTLFYRVNTRTQAELNTPEGLALWNELEAARTALRAAQTDEERLAEYLNPKDSRDTFLAGLPALDSLSED